MPQSAINFERTAQSEKVARSAGVVSVAIAMSRVTGLVREMVMAQKFGAGLSYDAFLLGFRIPNLTRDLFAEGAFLRHSSLHLRRRWPTADTRRRSGYQTWWPRRLWRLSVLVCLLGMIFSPQLVWLLAPGYAAVPGKFALGSSFDADHVPVSAGGGTGGAGDGRFEYARQIRRSSDGFDVFQYRIVWFSVCPSASGWVRILESHRLRAWRMALCWAASCNWRGRFPACARSGFTSGGTTIGRIRRCGKLAA